MKLRDIQDEYQNYDDVVKVTDFEHFFDVYRTQSEWLYNLNETLYLDSGDGKGFPTYTAKRDLQWTLASYEIYGTTRLAWLLMKLNKVDAAHMFDNIKAGQTIICLPSETVQNILNKIRTA